MVDRKNVIPFAILTLTILPYFLYNTWAPYHTDSAGFVLGAEKIVEGEVHPGWRWGAALIEAILGAIPYTLTGNPLWFHIMGTVAGISAFLVGLILLTDGWKSWQNAAIVAITLLSPAAIVTGTIGKEDLLAIGLILIGTWLGISGKKRAVLGGILMGLALATKEIAFALVAVASAYVFWRKKQHSPWLVGGIAASLPLWWPMLEFVLSNRSTGMGKFIGLWSGYGLALSMLYQGMGAAIAALLIASAVYGIIRRRWEIVAGAGAATMIILYLAGTSTVTYRNAVWIVPLVAYSASRMEKQWKIVAVSISALLALSTFTYLLPTLEFRALTNLPASFPEGASKKLDRNGVVLCMDSSALVRLYTGLETMGHPVFPDMGTAEKTVNEIIALKGKRPVYIYPDYLTYDSGNLMKAMAGCVQSPSTRAGTGITTQQRYTLPSRNGKNT